MKVFTSSQAASKHLKKGSAITMGNYDGLHVGHQAILRLLNKQARKRKLTSVVYTFEPHPVQVLAPNIAPPLINTLDQKLELIAKQKIDCVVVEKFDRPFARHSPPNFFKKFLLTRLNARFICVGYDFTFGAKRQGNIETLEMLGIENQVETEIVNPFLKGQTLVSSSLVRQVILEGKIKQANRFLGRDFFIEGRVIKGDKRGRTIGFPTANLAPTKQLLPPHGVYQTKTQVGNKHYASVTNIGVKPSFGSNKPTIETHLLKFKRSIYGQKIRVRFLNKIRDEKKFNSVEDLVKQIKRDIIKATSS